MTTITLFNNTMNTTIRYWLTNTDRCRYMSLSTYQQALDTIRLLSQINVKAEVKI